MEFFVAAYAVIWLVIFAFVFNMNRRMNKVSDELSLIEESLGPQK